MTKNIFIVFILVILVAVTVWFFVRKTKTASEGGDFQSLAQSNTSPIAGPQETLSTSIKMPNGLEITDINIGVGQEARTGNVVSVNYKGTFTDGKQFDSSYDRGEPFAFILGAGQVIKGWDQGVAGMKVGGKRKLIVPPELGYGPKDYGPIPGNSTLVFEVELLAVEEVRPQ